jgi:hypothetical protein
VKGGGAVPDIKALIDTQIERVATATSEAVEDDALRKIERLKTLREDSP